MAILVPRVDSLKFFTASCKEFFEYKVVIVILFARLSHI